ncbi:MAG TPA: hypothetical protein VM867_13640 [Xanthobacteraceae bacterium]|nr:hypothetical protein [Xanthobacteraceae bacterium]
MIFLAVPRALMPRFVMAGLVPAIHALLPFRILKKGVDACDKRGHDEVYSS